jgi:hypothetical protein
MSGAPDMDPEVGSVPGLLDVLAHRLAAFFILPARDEC